MIRYCLISDSWISGVNPDENGMPTTNLSGDNQVCTCDICFDAYIEGLGENHDEVHGYEK